MKLREIYEFAIVQGRAKDPRSAKEIDYLLKEEERRYQVLPAYAKEHFDSERLRNPYADTRVLQGNGEEDIQRVLVGIDIQPAELLLAEYLRHRGERIDLVIAHHPEGKARAKFFEVMDIQIDLLVKRGIPVTMAEGMLGPRKKEVFRRETGRNHFQEIDTARLLNIPLMCIHTPADNQVAAYLDEIFQQKAPSRLKEVLEILYAVPEYQIAAQNNDEPLILLGEPEKRAGRIFVDMTGGTEGSVEALERLAKAGVGTVICMHMSENHLKNAEKFYLNVVLAGHISSDTLGLNLLFDALEAQRGKLEYCEISGFRRVRRI